MREGIDNLIESAHLRLHAEMNAHLEVFGTTVTRWRILEALEQRNGVSLKELSRRTRIKPPALSKIVDRMVSDALVHRKQDPADHRRILLHISSFGEELVRKCTPGVQAIRNNALAATSDGFLSDLERLSRKEDHEQTDSTRRQSTPISTSRRQGRSQRLDDLM